MTGSGRPCCRWLAPLAVPPKQVRGLWSERLGSGRSDVPRSLGRRCLDLHLLQLLRLSAIGSEGVLCRDSPAGVGQGAD